MFPRWDELPVLDLYLDQVLLYVNKVCKPAFTASDKGLTASMINNYVKHAYLEKPLKKKSPASCPLDCYYKLENCFFHSRYCCDFGYAQR